ncbi:CoA-binding protein [Reichenbachiella versicolor]|uniref:CoA-binding protein n=1 Tax=Reichenbachiella versicolor TaxID=1821036 RepID=UPI000D6E3BA9|nr:CoA-binding protein [Reichenbachiella versicolor]
MDKKHTVVLGASTNPSRYAHMAVERLAGAGHPISLVSIKKGEQHGQAFQDLREKPIIKDVDTVTLYVGTQNLDQWKDYILDLAPKRIIMNPGTEHEGLKNAAEARGIEVVEGCTLVMLGNGLY